MIYEHNANILIALGTLPSWRKASRWARAMQKEARGRELLVSGDVDGALENFRASVEEKAAAVAEIEDEAREGFRRIELARNYLGIATLERMRGCVAAARAGCEEAIRILEIRGDSAVASGKSVEILREAREALVALDERVNPS